ncbi:MAG: phytoene/squalene synthase family protein [Nitratireductor sp.]|nr:phytoene/squalene synthase family protein [Nitratireductor sp.]
MTDFDSQESGLRDAFAHCAGMVREEDRPRYAARLFLPLPARDAVLALDAFRLETLKVPFLISEPGPGEIRLQWWREVVEGSREAEAAAHPVAMALCAVIARHSLPVPAFGRYLEGMAFDLYHDPVPDRAALEGLIGETESFLMQMAALAAGLEQSRMLADACGHGGMAVGIARLLRLLPWYRGRHQVRLPLDLLAEYGLDEAGFFDGQGGAQEAAKGEAVAAFARLGLGHAEKARAAVRQLPKAGRAVFLPLTEAELVLKAVEQSPGLAMVQSVSVSPMKAQWGLWRTALAGF